jgi:hypothetical protein
VDTLAAVLGHWLAQIDLPSLGQEGPDDLRQLLRMTFVLLPVGFAVGILGHLSGSKTLVAAGIAIVMIGAAFFFVASVSFG